MKDSVATHNAPLQDQVPQEIQVKIIQQLDPVGLISLSQACRFFRNLIQPGRNEFTERLLMIECLERYGGGTSLFYETHLGNVELHRTLGPWEGQRWACTSCLKLLPHSHFDNRSLLRLRNRKPSPEWPAASLTTSWVPSLHGRDSGRKARQLTKLAKVEEKKITVESGEAWPVPDEERCGYGRRKRRCNECRFKERALTPYLPRSRIDLEGGTREVPIVRSRQLLLDSCFHRYFPRLGDVLQCKPPPFPPRVYRPCRWDKPHEPWTLYMIRCPGCEQWKETYAFRIGPLHVKRTLVHNQNGELKYFWPRNEHQTESERRTRPLKGLRCNNCVEQQQGREALTEALLLWFRMVHLSHRKDIENRLKSIYWRLNYFGEQFTGYKEEIEDILREKKRDIDLLEHGTVAELRTQAAQFRELWGRMKHSNPVLADEITEDGIIPLWMDHFSESEAEWAWLLACLAKVEENPGLLADWALNQDAGSLKWWA
ncbi:unnamed protein product [Clonostachys rhizophaga]|uniref:F-box domain-containing protein n=1 Tax=Clonostachys rhizophaga TaxID=160324 RepID=A0A9N9VUY2_9HYPO|nr:unnamed protein product [Clonostachys rhizophaga]